MVMAGWKRIFVGLLALAAGMPLGLMGAETDAGAPVPRYMGLEEIRPGMAGEWKTVVQGTEIVSFPIEVLGVARNFVGPRRSVIICQAVDAGNILSGPVAGMSGSPVFIEGRLVGAYAYGYLWPKEQAIIGVTPIEEMLEVVDRFPLDPPPSRWPGEGLEHPKPIASLGGPAELGWEMATGSVPSGVAEVGTLLHPLPTPLVAGGFSRRTLDAFSDHWRRLGMEMVQGPAGSWHGGDHLRAAELEPGSAVAGVLMQGDFSIAGTGTVTWREGDRVLAFGHPFFQMGSTVLPMAAAEVITVVRSVPRSFKLSSTGPVIGSIYQDRLTAIAGRLGVSPAMPSFSVSRQGPDGVRREFRGEICQHPWLTPLLSAMALMESLDATLEVSPEQTIELRGEVGMAGLDPIRFRQIASGPGGSGQLAFSFYESLARLMDNPFGQPELESIDFQIEVRDRREQWALREVLVETPRLVPGEELVLRLRLLPFHGPEETHRVRLSLPHRLRRGDRLTVLVADGTETRRVEAAAAAPPDSIQDLARRWRESLANDRLYISLLQESPGLRVDGEALPGLPPSILSQLSAPARHQMRTEIRESLLDRQEVPLSGTYLGAYRISLTVE